MISGKNTAESCLLLVCLLGLFSQPVRAELTLSTLLGQFSRVTTAQARFTETRRLALLKAPLVSEGLLIYRAPDYLRKEISTPEPSRFEISGDELHIDIGTEQRTLSLDSHPLIRAFAESYRAILAGDAATLEHHFTTKLGGSIEHWTLHLEPRDSQVQEHMEAILVTGSGNQILSTETREISGDLAVMEIMPERNQEWLQRNETNTGNGTGQQD